MDEKTKAYLDVKFQLVSEQQNAILSKVDKIEQDFQKIDHRTVGHEKTLGVVESMIKGFENRLDKHEVNESQIGKETNNRLNALERFIDAQERNNYYISKEDEDIKKQLDRTSNKSEKTAADFAKVTGYIAGIVAAVGFLLLLVKFIVTNWGTLTGGFKL